jgi:8-oxo-dGTP diphosphatase
MKNLDPWNQPNAKLGAGAVVLHEGKVLLVKVNYGPAKGHWVIPGGRVEHNEPLMEAARREVLEETNVKIRPVGIVGIRQRTHPEIPTDIYFLFAAAVEGVPAELKSSDPNEITEVAFWSVEEALASAAVRPMAKAAIQWAVNKRNLLTEQEKPEGFGVGDALFA